MNHHKTPDQDLTGRNDRDDDKKSKILPKCQRFEKVTYDFKRFKVSNRVDVVHF